MAWIYLEAWIGTGCQAVPRFTVGEGVTVPPKKCSPQPPSTTIFFLQMIKLIFLKENCHELIYLLHDFSRYLAMDLVSSLSLVTLRPGTQGHVVKEFRDFNA